jgi:hypothetical protein
MRVLRVPCTDPPAAEAAAQSLRAQQVDIIGTDGRHVLVPAGGSPAFVWGLAEQLQAGGHGYDAELAAWAADATSPVEA